MRFPDLVTLPPAASPWTFPAAAEDLMSLSASGKSLDFLFSFLSAKYRQLARSMRALRPFVRNPMLQFPAQHRPVHASKPSIEMPSIKTAPRCFRRWSSPADSTFDLLTGGCAACDSSEVFLNRGSKIPLTVRLLRLLGIHQHEQDAARLRAVTTQP